MSKLPPRDRLLELVKTVAVAAGSRLLDHGSGDEKLYRHTQENSKEIKARADAILDKEILGELLLTGLPILSEESGLIRGGAESGMRFIVDPLDGTYNFVKKLGPSAVSIALWDENTPVFGVIYRLDTRELTWGGPGFGTYTEGVPLTVSDTTIPALGSLCTGFPARCDLSSNEAMLNFWRLIARFGKVRMLGSAAVSLLQVASGAAEAYSEKNIMLWDVAAGLALVAGAGGDFSFTAGTIDHSLDVYASNGRLTVGDALA